MEKDVVKLSLINSKGGVAKTATAHNLAHELSNNGKRVLLVDLDPQASLTLSCGIRPNECTNSIADVLLEGVPAIEVVCSTSVEGVDIIPGSIALSSFDVAVASESDRDSLLKTALDKIKDYDVILCDCAPTLGLLPVNALVASDYFIVPVVPEYLALEGLATLMSAVERIREGLGSCAELLGIVLTKVDKRARATRELTAVIRNHYGDLVFKTEVPINVRVSEAPSYGKTIFQHDWAASGAQAYGELGKDVLKRLKKQTLVKQ